MVFPGQGSQKVGMLADLADDHVLVQIFETVSREIGRDLRRLAIEGPPADLDSTTVTQPLMLATDVAFYAIQRVQGGAKPGVVAGHSLGEYPALYVAGVLELPALARLVAVRARLMQEAVAPGAGAMAAILGLDGPALEAVCRNVTSGVVEAVNYNCPGQIVIAGERAAVEAAMVAARAAGAKRALLLPVSVPAHSSLMKKEAAMVAARAAGAKRALLLPVSVPAHSSLMKKASRAYAHELAQYDLKPPVLPVVHNADLAEHPDPASIREALAAQLASPVRWTETIEHLRDRHGVSRIVECGPGRILLGLDRRIAPEIEHRSLENRETILQYAETR
jgi:[acyl-carrier-protein] S-malonyltransferase